MPPITTTSPGALGRLLGLLALALALAGCSLLPAQAPATTARPSARPSAAATSRPTALVAATPRPAATSRPTAIVAATPRPAAPPLDGFDALTPDQLPPEGRATLELIARGGPFPYQQDGAVFQNRERRLPRKPAGYYHEYTVVTPGSPDRGARRIITGERGEIFYTADHYDTFVQVLSQ